MNVVSKKKLRVFWEQYPEAKTPLTRWYNLFRKTTPANFAELRSTFATADFADPFTVFNVGGNKYRVIVIVDYQSQFSKIKHVFSHTDYDHWRP